MFALVAQRVSSYNERTHNFCCLHQSNNSWETCTISFSVSIIRAMSRPLSSLFFLLLIRVKKSQLIQPSHRLHSTWNIISNPFEPRHSSRLIYLARTLLNVIALDCVHYFLSVSSSALLKYAKIMSCSSHDEQKRGDRARSGGT